MKLLRNFFKKYFLSEGNTCRLLEIDILRQEVKFQLKVKLPILKCSLYQAINDLRLISQLSSVEACYLGGHYGKVLSEKRLKSDNQSSMSFLLKNSLGRYSIVCQDRSGRIGYYDKYSKTTFSKKPIDIVKDENIIKYFNSSQACYIGILAGIELISLPQKDEGRTPCKPFMDKLYLRIVK